jgi:glycosyltransferase involved in cell wall biosynthesis
MPFRNSEKFLDESIISILNQTYSDFEFIIINDASTDASDEFVKRYLGDRRIRYIKLIISAPPSPEIIFLVSWKEKQPRLPMPPRG